MATIYPRSLTFSYLSFPPLRPAIRSAGIAAHTVLVLKYLKLDSQSHEVLLYDITQILQGIALHPPASQTICP